MASKEFEAREGAPASAFSERSRTMQDGMKLEKIELGRRLGSRTGQVGRPDEAGSPSLEGLEQ